MSISPCRNIRCIRTPGRPDPPDPGAGTPTGPNRRRILKTAPRPLPLVAFRPRSERRRRCRDGRFPMKTNSRTTSTVRSIPAVGASRADPGGRRGGPGRGGHRDLDASARGTAGAAHPGGRVVGGAVAFAIRSATAEVTIYVTGKVRRPGVIALPLGSRVVDAIMAAGGLKQGADPGGLNLARRVIDGEQIAVGEPGSVAAPRGCGLGVRSGRVSTRAPSNNSTSCPAWGRCWRNGSSNTGTPTGASKASSSYARWRESARRSSPI